MASNIPLFTTLDSSMYTVVCETPFKLYYKMKDSQDEEEVVDLSLSPSGSSFRTFMVKDEVKGHRPDDYRLSVSKEITLINCSNMFGLESLAPTDAELGVALMWKSHDSKQRGSRHMCDVSNFQGEQTWKISYTFPKALFRGMVSFSVVIYLKKSGLFPGTFQCDTEGSILGELEQYCYIFDGQGSMFPVVTIDDARNPLLWTVDCSWSDPEEDFFADSVLIKFNKANRNFDKICYGNAKFDRQMFMEVISSAMSVVFSTVREKDPEVWKDMLSDGYISQQGSVTQVIKYMIETNELDLTDAYKSSVSMRTFLDKRLKR